MKGCALRLVETLSILSTPFEVSVRISIDLSGILEDVGFWKTLPPMVNEIDLVVAEVQVV
jgi:hypothetical protein